MKIVTDIKSCYECPFVKRHADHPVSDDGIIRYDYKCGGVKFPEEQFDIKDVYKIDKRCPFKKSKKKVVEKEERFVLNPTSELTKFIKGFRGKVSPEARKFFTEYAVGEPKRSALRGFI